jgi:hypothetical protein
VRFATTIDDGGQRTGSRGRYSPPPSPPRESEDARELDPRDHVVHHRGGPLPSSLSSRQSREDTPPGGNMHAMLAPPVVARAAREDTPPAGAGHGGGSIDSTATGDADDDGGGGGGGVLKDRRSPRERGRMGSSLGTDGSAEYPSDAENATEDATENAEENARGGGGGLDGVGVEVGTPVGTPALQLQEGAVEAAATGDDAVVAPLEAEAEAEAAGEGDDALGGARAASSSSPARVLGRRDGDAREISPSPEAKRRETSPPPPSSE